MDVLAFRDLPVGILWWESPARTLSVFVKMTLAVFGDEPEIETPSPPLCFDEVPAFGSPGELEYASDFVPKKRHLDLMLTGHVHAAAPRSAIAARIVLFSGEKRLFEKRFYAMAAEPSVAIPLSSAYLRAEPTSNAAPVSLRPLSPWSEVRARQIGRLPLGVHGGPLVALPPEFDFGVFNSAPLDQRLDPRIIDASQGLSLLLEGLHPKKAQCRFQLPAERPRIYARSAHAQGGPGLSEIPLQCDTLWIHSDMGHCTMVFRGTMVLKDPHESPDELVLTFAPYGLPDNLMELGSRLQKSKRKKAQSFEDLVDSGSKPSAFADDEATHAIQLSALTGEALEEIVDFEEIKTEDEARGEGELELEPELEPEAEIEPESEPVPTPRLPVTAPESNSTIKSSKSIQLDEETTSAGFVPPSRNALPFVVSALASPSEPPGPKATLASPPPSPGAPALPFRAPIELQPPLTQANTIEFIEKTAPHLPLDEPTSERAPAEQAQPAAPEVPFALPFARSERKATFVPGVPAEAPKLRPVLPFAPHPKAPSQSDILPPSTPSPEPPRPSLHTALPFVQAQPPPQSIAALAPPPPLEVPRPAHPVLRLPPLQIGNQSEKIEPLPTPAPTQAVFNPIELLIPLERYAALQMDLWQAADHIEGIFERHGTSELEWRNDEQKRASALAQQAKEGRSDFALSIAEALAQESARRAGQLLLDTIAPELYASVRAELEEAGDIDQVLQNRGISDTSWQAVHRMYQKRASSDPGFFAELRALLEQARQAGKNTKKEPEKRPIRRRSRKASADIKSRENS